MTYLAPSILSADLLNLQSQVTACQSGGADMIHVDVMDGQFVPNITMGPVLVNAVNKVTDLPLDVHLMIENPDNFIDEFVQAGADYLTVHQEAAVHLDRTIQKINSLDVKSGISLNPATSVDTIKWILSEVDLVLIMSVNPGFGGQKFIPYILEKIKELDKLRQQGNYDFSIQVDGGINQDNANSIVDAGADILVAGSAIFSSQMGIESTVQSFKRQCYV